VRLHRLHLPPAGVGARIAPIALPAHLRAPAQAGAFAFCGGGFSRELVWMPGQADEQLAVDAAPTRAGRGGGLTRHAIIADRPQLQPPCPATPSLPTPCPTQTARCTWATWWVTSRPTSGCGRGAWPAVRCITSAPTTPTARRSCWPRRRPTP